VGITDLKGKFDRGDTVRVVNSAGSEVARGLVNYTAAELSRIVGKKSKEIEAILGSDYDDEVIHRNNLVLL
jgi:glutamate 5-kinase